MESDGWFSAKELSVNQKDKRSYFVRIESDNKDVYAARLDFIWDEESGELAVVLSPPGQREAGIPLVKQAQELLRVKCKVNPLVYRIFNGETLDSYAAKSVARLITLLDEKPKNEEEVKERLEKYVDAVKWLVLELVPVVESFAESSLDD